MDFSVWPNIKYPVDEVLDLARWLDDGRWHGMWFADHYMPNTGTTEVNDGDSHEVWGLLPAVAVVTERLRLGDRAVIDGTLHGLTGLARYTAGLLGRVQTGSLHLYAWLVLAGIFACLAWSWGHV